MVRLHFDGDTLTIDVGDADKLKTGILKSGLVFDAGFLYDESTTSYRLGRGRDPKTSLEYAVNLLDSEGIGFEADSRVEQIKGQIQTQIQGIESAISTGKEIKKKSKLSDSLPPGFQRPLLRSQRMALALHEGLPFSADFSVPGAGKTWIAYATYSILKERGDVDRLLVVGPISSFRPWQEEHHVIFGRDPSVQEVKGSRNERHQALETSDEKEIFLMSYHSVSNDEKQIAELLAKHKFMVVLDESHNVKQPEAKRTNAILRLAPLCKRRMILTGTPIPRSIEDIYTQFSFLDPENNILGESRDFGELIDEDESLDRLKERISPFYFRIRKSDFDPKLPQAIFHREFVELGSGRIRGENGEELGKVDPCPVQESIYYAIEGRIFELIKKDKQRREGTGAGPSLDEMTRLKRWQRNRLIRLLEVASNPSLLMREDLEIGAEKIDSAGLPIYEKIEEYHKLQETPAKLQRVEQIVHKELDKSASSKIIIWTSFVQNIKELRRMLKQYSPARVHGDIAKNPDENQYLNRIGEVARFKNNSECRVLIANPASLAESVSLHKNLKGEVVCSTAIYLDRTFNGAHYMQSLDRIHRIGLEPDQQVLYYLLESADTVDLDVDESLATKVENMRQFLDDDIRRFSLETKYDDITDGTSDREDYERVVRRLQAHAEEGRFA